MNKADKIRFLEISKRIAKLTKDSEDLTNMGVLLYNQDKLVEIADELIALTILKNSMITRCTSDIGSVADYQYGRLSK